MTNNITSLVKQEALRLGFDACGICKAEFTDEHAKYLQEWLNKGYNGEMSYMSRNVEIRCNSRLLFENAKSVIVVALNYYPEKKQKPIIPQIAYYAYGKDYHIVVKEKLQQLYDYINMELLPVNGKTFCDTAPVLEKYHAQKAGLGWIGKNTQFIIPKKGSFFFLGGIVIDKELDYDIPVDNKCGTCTKCIDACPTKAIVASGVLNASRCLSYLSLEYKGQTPIALSGNYIYGCDICNKACPHNQFAQATALEEFKPSEALLNLDENQISRMNEEEFTGIFKNSPVKRIGLNRLKTNCENLLKIF